MNLKDIIELSKKTGKPFKRPNWHYCLWYEEMLGYYTDGYNGMDCSFLPIDEAIADDFQLQENSNNIE